MESGRTSDVGYEARGVAREVHTRFHGGHADTASVIVVRRERSGVTGSLGIGQWVESAAPGRSEGQAIRPSDADSAKFHG